MNLFNHCDIWMLFHLFPDRTSKYENKILKKIEMREDIMVSRYVVLTGDLKSSRKLKDRAKVQESLKKSLNEINATFKKGIVAKFRIVQGDSF